MNMSQADRHVRMNKTNYGYDKKDSMSIILLTWHARWFIPHLYQGLGEHSILIGWKVWINFWYTDISGTPQVVPVMLSVLNECALACI